MAKSNTVIVIAVHIYIDLSLLDRTLEAAGCAQFTDSGFQALARVNRRTLRDH